jgi:osmotically-inducible protein OsmY
MVEESRFDREPAGRGYGGSRAEDRGPDYGRGEYRGRDYGREGFGRGYRGGGYRDERDYGPEGWGGGYGGDYGREGQGRGGYGRRDEGRGGLGYGREGAGYGQGGGVGYGHEGYGGGYGREDYGRRSGEDWRGREGGYGRGGYGGRGGEERGFRDRASDEVSSWFGDEDAERRRQMDERRSGGAWRVAGGGYRGRGPRGYTRSDERIREDVSDRLTDDFFVDASDIEVTVSGCEVTLGGTVNNRDERRRAEDIAEDVSGVKHVQNNLRVRHQQGGLTGTGAGQTGAGTPLQGRITAMGGGEGAPTAANEPSTDVGRSSAA